MDRNVKVEYQKYKNGITKSEMEQCDATLYPFWIVVGLIGMLNVVL